MDEQGASREDVFYRFALALHEAGLDELTRRRLENLCRELALEAYLQGQRHGERLHTDQPLVSVHGPQYR